MKNKITDLSSALDKVKDGDVIMIGGFLHCGHPDNLVKSLCSKPVGNLTVISNDTGTTELSSYELIKSGKVTKIHGSYIGANPETGRLLYSKEAEVFLWPQGTLAEKIRTGGAGLGGFLTPVGLGTVIEEGKEKITVNGKTYLLELPLRANVALIKANKADKAGNLYMAGTSRNFNELMATAADWVIAEVDELVEVGELDPNSVTVPGIFIDAIVKK